MAFPTARDPYNIRVTSVTVDGSPVSGAVITLYNSTKSTNTAKTSNETNSNITINLSECGDWTVGDIICVKASYGGDVASSSNHTTATGDNGRFEFGTIAITSGTGTWKKIMWSDDPMSITVRKNSGSDVGTRKRLNFIEGGDITLAITDDSGSDEIDISVTSTGGGSTTWTGLTDTASSISALRLVRGNSGGSALEMVVQSTFKLDDFGAPDDNTDLNSTTSYHGLLPKLGGGTTNYLRSDGVWATPSGSGVSDHGALTGLADYDHDQYLRRNGGNTITGNLLPDATTNYRDLGSSAQKWDDVYAQDVRPDRIWMGGTLDMNDYLIDDVDDIQAFDANGVLFRNYVATSMCRIGYLGYSFYAYADVHLNTNDITGVGDITAVNGIFGDLIFTERTCERCGNILKDGEDISLIVIKTSDKGTHTVPIHTQCRG